ILQDDARLTLIVEAADPHGDQIAHAVRGEGVGEDDVGGETLAEERRGSVLAAGRAARHHHDGIRLGYRVLHDEGAADQAQGGAVGNHGKHERCDDEAAPAYGHRSSSTRYSLIRRESGASGLRARYFRKASLAFSGCLLW